MVIMRTKITGSNGDVLHMHWGIKELFLILAFIATPAVGIIRTMIVTDRNKDDISAIQEQAKQIQDNVNVNARDIAVNKNQMDNIGTSVKNIESKVDQLIILTRNN